ncbi:MAG: hypothetical protein AAF434_04035 [Pseudomonadota bacterium]
MYQFLSCINLKPDQDLNEFRRELHEFAEILLEKNLLVSMSPVGRRDKHPVMDTDDERKQEYYFLMTFKDREQCDQAVEFIYSNEDPGNSVHRNMYKKTRDQVFICWEEL